MFTRILVPLDGSSRAEAALPVAARIARGAGGMVMLTRVVSVAPELNPYFVLPPGGAPALTEGLMEGAADYLARIAGSEVLAGVATERETLPGLAAQAILGAVASQRADLIVMTSRGRTGLGRWVLGSTAQHVARHADVPVLVLHEERPLVDGTDKSRPLGVLVPLDGSERAEAVLPSVADLAAALRPPRGTALHLVYVVDPTALTIAQLPEAIAVEGANAYLGRVAARLSTEYPDRDLTVTWEVLKDSDTAGALIALAEAGGDAQGADAPAHFDMAAMATHGLTGLARWAVGSVAERVLGNARLPLLIVRPRDVAARPLRH